MPKTFTRSFIMLCGSMLFLLSCSPQKEEQAKHGYKITATVKNCEGCQVKMYAEQHLGFQDIDSTVVGDEGFTLKGDVPESGFYTVNLHVTGKRHMPIQVYLPADSIHLIIDAENKVRTKFYTRDNVGHWLPYVFVGSTSPIQREV